MCAPAYDRPHGVSRFTEACAVQGWVLAVERRRAFSWSASTGWQALPPAPGDLGIVGEVAAGILVIARHTSGPDRLGFWSVGAAGWAFWRDEQEATTQIVDDDAVFVYGQDPADERLRLGFFAPGSEPLVPLATTKMDSCPEDWGLILAGARLPDGRFRVLTERKLLELDTDGGFREIGPLSLPEQSFWRGAVAFGRHVALLGGLSGSPFLVDAESGAIELARFPSPDTPLQRLLWRAALREDRLQVERLIAHVGDLPSPPPGEEVEPYAVVLVEGRPEVVATSHGVARPVAGLPDDATLRSFVRHRLEVPTWHLWLDPASHLVPLLWNVLETGGSPTLFEGLAREGGEDLPRLAFERARSASGAEGERHYWSVHVVGDLFSRSPATAVPLVLAGLDDPSTCVRRLAFAGARSRPIGTAMLEPALRPTLEAKLRAALAAEDAPTRAEAAAVVGELGLAGFAGSLAVLVGSDESDVRQASAKALGAVPDRSPAALEALMRAALSDPDGDVRRSSVDALGTAGAEAGETLAVAVADTDTFVRSRALHALETDAGRLETPLLYGVVDRCLVLLVIGAEAERCGGSRSEFTGPVDAALTSVSRALFQRLTGAEATGSFAGLLAVPAERARLAAPMMATGLVMDRIFPDTSSADERGAVVERADEFFRRLGDPPLLSREEIERLVVSRRPPASLVAEIALRILSLDEAWGRRCALLAVVASQEIRDSRPGARPRTLSTRLRAAGGPSGLDRCVAVARALAGEPTPVGLTAACVLAARRDAGARSLLEERAFAGDLERFPVLGPFLALLGGKGAATLLVERVASTAALDAARRKALVEAILRPPVSNQASPPDAIRLRLATDCAASPDLPLDYRLGAGRDALDLGDASVLSRVWKERERGRPLNPEERFERSLDLAACGDAEHFDVVRTAFPERGDRRSLTAFKLFGTPEDIPRLEAAGWVVELVAATVAAIRARHEPTPGGGRP